MVMVDVGVVCRSEQRLRTVSMGHCCPAATPGCCLAAASRYVWFLERSAFRDRAVLQLMQGPGCLAQIEQEQEEQEEE
ncbi:Hypothetical protein ZHAS_00007631 [Anopheles sinensis]|uniref:Uncharacterized protein n=1 Tax=Anopheles sinensis TaxID=74873 RepID=A0A084VQ55_ANOSI|nr:Hypothetical protein ZHAS_00007631 [Anopheles sinensis]